MEFNERFTKKFSKLHLKIQSIQRRSYIDHNVRKLKLKDLHTPKQ